MGDLSRMRSVWACLVCFLVAVQGENLVETLAAEINPNDLINRDGKAFVATQIGVEDAANLNRAALAQDDRELKHVAFAVAQDTADESAHSKAALNRHLQNKQNRYEQRMHERLAASEQKVKKHQECRSKSGQ